MVNVFFYVLCILSEYFNVEIIFLCNNYQVPAYKSNLASAQILMVGMDFKTVICSTERNIHL